MGKESRFLLFERPRAEVLLFSTLLQRECFDLRFSHHSKCRFLKRMRGCACPKDLLSVMERFILGAFVREDNTVGKEREIKIYNTCFNRLRNARLI